MNKEKRSFDYDSLAEKYDIDANTLNNIIKETYKEFPDDEMLAELHVIRAIKAYKKNIH